MSASSAEPRALASEPIWTPSPERAAASRIAAFARFAHAHWDAPVDDAGPDGYPALHRWSVERPDRFWPAVWACCDLLGDGVYADMPPSAVVLRPERMAPPDGTLGPRWFPDVRLNFAENLLRWRDDRPAIIAWTERGRERVLTHAELHREVERVATAFAAWGVRAGDRVAGLLPNIAETVIGMLAATSLGAIWSSCSPEFGVDGVLDRFGQVEPKVLVAADGYRFAGKAIDVLPRVREVARRIPSIERIVLVPVLDDAAVGQVPRAVRWDDLGHDARPLDVPRLPFDHPLYVLYSSGTTGLPKGIVHGAGGTLLQHAKELALHVDVGRDDRVAYLTTCGWMMWNWLVSTLALGATVVLYDGAPMAGGGDLVWEMAAREGVTVFGTSAKHLALLEKTGVRPGADHDLSAMRALLSTGSPLAAHSFDWVYEAVCPDVHLASISGGTDIISCFVLGNPAMPVYRGEIQVPGLGMAVDAWDEAGRPVRGVPGELVCTRPFPSMPIRFWNDDHGVRYQAAYFEHFPGVWRHGDWVERTEHGGFIIHGRSDATLNAGGVRIGTAEIYRQVEQLDEILESLAVAQQVPGGDPGDVQIVLFVRLRDGLVLDDALRDRIRRRLREHASVRHVPKHIVQVPQFPRTFSGKPSELAVSDALHGRPVRNQSALANPEALDYFHTLHELFNEP